MQNVFEIFTLTSLSQSVTKIKQLFDFPDRAANTLYNYERNR